MHSTEKEEEVWVQKLMLPLEALGKEGTKYKGHCQKHQNFSEFV